MSVQNLSSEQIVKQLETNTSKQFTEAAHAEMMRRFVVANEKQSKRIFWLTLTIVLLTTINLIVTISNFLST
jgi:hypothetical protein